MVELFCDSFKEMPRHLVLDIDDTEGRVHGGQQLALFHAHYDNQRQLGQAVLEGAEARSQRPLASGE